MADFFKFLRRVPLFSGLSDSDIRIIQDTCREERLEAGEVIFREDEAGDKLYILMEGSVEIWKDFETPNADLLSVYGPGQMFGEMALIDNSPRSASVVVRQSCGLLTMERSDFNRMIQANPISQSIMRSLSEVIRNRTSNYVQGMRIRNRKLEKAYERLKKTEAQRNASLREKEVLLREIHHRVKNNMQIINSILSLQTQRVEDPMTLALFQDCRNRVKTMSLIHETLFESPDLSRVEARAYLRKVVRHLSQSLGADPSAVRISIDADDILLFLDDAVPVGLIVNELLSNALRHAFPGERTGHVRISLKPENRNGGLSLQVMDNGIGLPEREDIFDSGPNIGLNMVKGLAEKQLGGNLNVEREEGTRFLIRFSPKNRPKNQFINQPKNQSKNQIDRTRAGRMTA